MEYFEELKCFFVDNARVQRILSILAVPKFASKVRKLSLTACCLEARAFGMLEVVEKGNESLREAQSRYVNSHRDQQAEMYMRSEPNFSTIRDLLQYYLPEQAEVDVELMFLRHNHFEKDVISFKLLDALALSGTSIAGLTLRHHDMRPLDTLRTRRNARALSLETIRILQYLHGGNYYTEASREAPDFHILVPIVSGLKRLESLRLFLPQRVDYEVGTTINRLLSLNSVCYLRLLNLAGAPLDNLNTLLAALHRCSGTMRTLCLEDIVLYSVSEPYGCLLELLDLLQKLPHLDFLRLKQIHFGITNPDISVWIRNENPDGGRCAHYLHIEVEGRRPVETALKQFLAWLENPGEHLSICDYPTHWN
jgi:hypothetical protein